MATEKIVSEVVGHTPGPWSLHPYRTTGIVDANDQRPSFEYADICIGAGEKILATVNFNTLAGEHSGYPHVDDRAEHEANARLIVAAPDYKALVDRAIAVLQRHAPPDGLSDHDALSEFYGIFDGPEYRATIAKAEGREVPGPVEQMTNSGEVGTGPYHKESEVSQ